ncbi:MAG: hypothetical protein FJX80_03535 [Bacteroidetes bacterium]|nr:hypothetical protein [Bacteroidota bacterium]
MAEVSFNFDELEIVGVFGRKIYVKAKISIDDLDDEIELYNVWGCLEFSMTTWIELQKKWIKEKKEYCERYDYFCGFGTVASTAENKGDVELVIDNTNEVVLVPLYKPLDFYIDMEHG